MFLPWHQCIVHEADPDHYNCDDMPQHVLQTVHVTSQQFI